MVLVVGGAGYIGSHLVRSLLRAGQSVRVFDNLEKGHRKAIEDAQFIQGDLRQPETIPAALAGVSTVVHFAAYSEVGEGERNPEAFYENNVQGTRNLLLAMINQGLRKIVFSSTAAVYGEPQTETLAEVHPTSPTSVYGKTKLQVEQMLAEFESQSGINSVRLRYFNAAGAETSGRHGEDHRPESHLIPLVIQAALGRRNEIQIFGTDYPTPDGTCIRDYVHVEDLASAHEMAMAHLQQGGESRTFNLGSGRGYSVREVVAAVAAAMQSAVPFIEVARRAGDPSCLVANSEAIQKDWGWKASHSGLDRIVEDAVRWHRDNPFGYGD